MDIHNRCYREDCTYNQIQTCRILKDIEPTGCKSFYESKNNHTIRQAEWLAYLEKNAGKVQAYRDKMYGKASIRKDAQLSVDKEIKALRNDLREAGYDV